MSRLTAVPLAVTGSSARAAFAGARWLGALTLHTVGERLSFEVGDEEACVVLLAGTFDLLGGGSSWPSRGARMQPTEGRPVAVFLPPGAPFSATPCVPDAAPGAVLVVTARRPAAPPKQGREALSEKPLLQMAGSDKSFDPATGEWRPAESFASAAEHLTPRRIERVQRDGAVIERVFAAGYKAATLTVDEIVLQPGAVLRLRDLALPPAVECGIYARGTGASTVRVTAGGAALDLGADGPAAALCSAPPTDLALENGDAVAYVLIAYAGK